MECNDDDDDDDVPLLFLCNKANYYSVEGKWRTSDTISLRASRANKVVKHVYVTTLYGDSDTVFHLLLCYHIVLVVVKPFDP